MKRQLLVLSLAFVASLIAAPATARVMLTFSSSTDLNHLGVGQELTIDVNLSGLPANDFIFNLDSKALFPSTEFKAVPEPTNTSGLTPGTVFLSDPVFGPKQRANFNATSSLASTAATGDFSDNSPQSAAAIGQNGIYYSFTLRAISAGSGSISFDPSAGANQYAANDTGFAFAALPTGGPLAFSIAPVAAPEPSTILMASAGLIAVAGFTPIVRSARAHFNRF